MTFPVEPRAMLTMIVSADLAGSTRPTAAFNEAIRPTAAPSDATAAPWKTSPACSAEEPRLEAVAFEAQIAQAGDGHPRRRPRRTPRAAGGRGGASPAGRLALRGARRQRQLRAVRHARRRPRRAGRGAWWSSRCSAARSSKNRPARRRSASGAGRRCAGRSSSRANWRFLPARTTTITSTARP